jgi:biopolymer transport protein ExbD
MRKLTSRFVALLLAFGVGLGLYLALHDSVSNRRSAPRAAEIAGILTPAKIVRLDPVTEEVQTVAPRDYMLLLPAPAVTGPDVNEPVPLPTPGLDQLSLTSCGLLLVSVDDNRRLKLNSVDAGTLAETGSLTGRVAEVFLERERHRAFRPGMEMREDFAVRERIEKTVIVQPSRSLSYGEVLGLMGELEKAGAKPLYIQVGELKN